MLKSTLLNSKFLKFPIESATRRADVRKRHRMKDLGLIQKNEIHHEIQQKVQLRATKIEQFILHKDCDGNRYFL